MSRSPDRPLKPAIAYIRVSTEKQGRNGHGLDIQIETIREFARHAGYEIITIFSDAHTGMGEDSIRERTGAAAAVKLSRAKQWPIIVDGLDRFSRSTRTIEEHVLREGLEVISCRPGESGSYAAIMSVATRAQRVGELISRTTKEALQALKAQGKKLGNPHLDLARKNGAAATKARAEDRVREMFPIIRELREAGHTTAKAVAEGLNAKGLRTPQGKDWTGSNVRRLLEQVAALHKSREHAADLEDPNWGTW